MKAIVQLGIIVIGLFIIYLSVRSIYTDVVKPKITPVKVGQIWVMESDDPFDPEPREYLILDTLSGWVKYCKIKYVERPDRDEFSMTAKQETIARIMRLKPDTAGNTLDDSGFPAYKVQEVEIPPYQVTPGTVIFDSTTGRVRIVPRP